MKQLLQCLAGWLRTSLLRQYIALVSLTAALLLLSNYLLISHYFFSSLLTSISDVETDYMHMQADNIELLLRNYRTRLYEVVIDRDLLALAKQYTKTGARERAPLDRAIQDNLSRHMQIADIVGATLVMTDGSFIYNNRYKAETLTSFGWFAVGRVSYNEALAALCERTQRTRSLQIGLDPLINTTSGAYLLHMAYPLYDLYLREPFGTVVLSLNTKNLCEMTNPADGRHDGSGTSIGVLMEPGGRIIAHADAAMIGRRLIPGGGAADDGPDAMPITDDELLLTQPLQVMDMCMYRVIDKAELLAAPQRYTITVTIALSIIEALLLVLITLFVRQMVRSLRALQQGLHNVRGGDLGARVESGLQNEIGDIIREFNDMSGRLKESDEQRRAQEMETLQALDRRRISEIKALENQINSHFLYNTLNSINYSALAGGNLTVSRQLKHLSQMLRYTFEKSDGVVNCEREAEWLLEYLALQKLRYGGAFDYQVALDPAVARWPMRKLILQPFVENSLMHGFAGRTGGGQIAIRFAPYREDAMRVIIQDNGCGMDPDVLKSLSILFSGKSKKVDAGGIGLENAHLRIQSYYHGTAKVILRSWRGVGTKVVLLLPRYRANA